MDLGDGGFPDGASGKRIHLPIQLTYRRVSREDPLEEGMATHSNILAWRVPWTEKPGRLQSIGWHSRTQLKRLTTHAELVEKIALALRTNAVSLVAQLCPTLCDPRDVTRQVPLSMGFFRL